MNDHDIPLLRKLNNYGNNGFNRSIKGIEVGNILRGYKNLVELLPNTLHNAIIEPLNPERAPLTHRRLRSFVTEEFDLTKYGIGLRSRVAILLPNGPELALCIICVISGWCAAPINPTNSWQEIKMELQSTQSVAIIILAGAPVNEAALRAANELEIGVISITPLGSITGLFSLSVVQPIKAPKPLIQPNSSNVTVNGHQSFDHPEIVLLLHTSGTSGNKKLVPHSLDALAVGVGCIVSSWALTPQDICLNMMPLFHVGGIFRNIFSPILSGGAVIACNGFDPILFWDVLADTKVTWYYASPTMHHAILMEAGTRSKPLPVTTVRYIANAAGGLLPLLAKSLKDTFDAVILTSYGMTECMPISSPPQDYNLDPQGTSGIAVGPDIIIVDDDLKPIKEYRVQGNIFVKGPPCFGGYENNGQANDESFFSINGEPGWFNTGDMGSLDEQGYLYISGRSKEIINRGGETISPFEIEEAVVQHPSVKETLAFSAPHEKYQESVGVIIVTKKNVPRVDLPALHAYLENKLHRSKWPQLIVYSDGLPKNATGKILRIKFAQRASMENVDEESPPFTRLYEMRCPAIGTPLSTPIILEPVARDLNKTLNFLMNLTHVLNALVINVDLDNVHQDHLIAFVVLSHAQDINLLDINETVEKIRNACETSLDRYIVPDHIFPVDEEVLKNEMKLSITSSNGKINSKTNHDRLKELAIQKFQQQYVVAPRNDVEKQIEQVWRNYLGTNSILSVTSSFFALGGDSLKAGQLINAMRRALNVQLSVADLFAAPTIEGMAVKVSTMMTIGSPRIFLTPQHQGDGYGAVDGKAKGSPSSLSYQNENQGDPFYSYESANLFTNTSFSCLFVQALPILFIFPVRRIVIWFLIAGPWVYLMSHGHGRFMSLLAAMFIARLMLGVCAPLVGILAKWVIIGRYQAGRYPLWGSMYLKWWIVEQIVAIMGKGFFRDDLPIIGPHLVRLYYVMMGAQIGMNVKIHKDAKLGQADLLCIGDDVAIDNCTIRPFAIDEGHFILLPIKINDRCSIGVKAIIHPGATLPSGTGIGPLSSSHELDDADQSNRQYCRPTYKPPSMWLVILLGIPIMIVINVIAMIPWYLVLELMVYDAKLHNWYAADIHSIYRAFLWWITPQRLVFFFILRVVKRCVIPFIKLSLIIGVKRWIVGKFSEMKESEKSTEWNRFRYWLMSKLLPGGRLVGVSRLVGTHYEIISLIYRWMGAKIGKRVYWPGSGVEIVEFDLFEVGDDVVFGSRSVVFTSSTTASKKVVLEAGCMIADRSVILPGVTVKKGAVLGSGSLAKENAVIPIGSVWVGSQAGSAICVSPADQSYNIKDTISPFGRAFYEGKANYFVIPLWLIVVYNTLWQAICTCYRNCYTPLSLIICSYLLQFDPIDERSPLELFQFALLAFMPLHLLLCIIALWVDIIGKWMLMGRRKQGEYAWDQSSYCQRWQAYLTLQEIRKGERHKIGILDMIEGSQYLVWYFRALGSQIGNNVCLYPNGGDPMLTEPDLVTIEDNVGIDDTSLIAHINTRGIFRLNPLFVGMGCVLKSHTRLLSGASMEAHSIMLEHTLVMAGETVDVGRVWQGWPSRSQVSLLKYRNQVRGYLEQVIQDSLADERYSKNNKDKKSQNRNGLELVHLKGGNHIKSNELIQYPSEIQPLLA